MSSAEMKHANSDLFQCADGRMPPESAAAYVGCTVKTLAQWRWQGVGPPFVKLRGRIYYFRQAIDGWIDRQSGLSSTQQAKVRPNDVR